MPERVAVIGGGLAGCEIAWQLNRRDVPVTILEMKPHRYSPAHSDPLLAELVCSNSFRSEDTASCVGLLKQEMQSAASLILEAAHATRVPAGKALAVDRKEFSSYVTDRLQSEPAVDIRRREIETLSDPVLTRFGRLVIAAGPLASQPLARSLVEAIGQEQLAFYDAMAPIVSADSINWERVFWGSRYDPDSTDYLNCPLSEEEYHQLIQALLQGEKVRPREFETHFEGCLPVETMAERGEMTLAFGPLKPVGLVDPRTGETPFAVVQLRPENRAKTMFNLVGFQTKLTYPEQRRILRMIPGLENAEFVRLGSIHRNTFVNSPAVLRPNLELAARPNIYLAGQITGVEGYVESAACGLWLGMYLGRGGDLELPPADTALGGLLGHLQSESKNFQPMNVNFGLLPPLKVKAKKWRRKELYAERAQLSWREWLERGEKKD